MNRTRRGNHLINANGGYRMLPLWKILLLLSVSIVPTQVCSANWSPLPDTGQKICYNTKGTEITCPEIGQPLFGQDGWYQGVAPDYKDNGNQTVTDQQSGLMWTKSSEEIQHTWQDAITYCNDLEFAGQTDWRLPGKFELESIVDYGKSYPAINEVFDCQRSFYWSSTPHTDNPVYAWSVYCYDGADHWVHKTNEYFVRCIRDARSVHTIGPYTDKNNTVMDQGTGLEWQKSDNGIEDTWQNALAYCETLSLDSKNDWRLPNIRELKSLVDYGKYYPAIDPDIPCQSSNYWSATTVTNYDPASAWSVFFGNGDDIWKVKTESYHVRCVRAGLSGQ